MKNNYVTWILIVLTLAVGIIAYPQLPEQLPIHWSNTQADTFVHKSVAILTIPALMVLSYAFISLGLKLTENETKNLSLVNKVTNYTFAVLLVVQLFTLAFGLGMEPNIGHIQGGLLGIVCIILANPMQKAKPNLIYGLRTPWTLKDERVWKKSNRFSAKLLMAIGILILIFTFIFPNEIITISLLLIVVGMAVAIWHSYYVYKKIKES